MKKEILNDVTLYSAFAGMMLTSVLGTVISVFILLIVLILSLALTEKPVKEKLMSVTARTFAWIIGILATHLIVYVKIKYGF
jgi:hypothetical protein